jgi:hypothetical protein
MSTNVDVFVPSLYQCVETVVSATSSHPFQPLRHQRNVRYASRPSCEPLYATDTSHLKQKTFL